MRNGGLNDDPDARCPQTGLRSLVMQVDDPFGASLRAVMKIHVAAALRLLGEIDYVSHSAEEVLARLASASTQCDAAGRLLD
jgi:hypothetical protein